MGVIIAVAIAVAVVAVVSKIGDWFDAKTGWVLGAIVTGLVIIALLYAARTAANPHPGCQYVGNC